MAPLKSIAIVVATGVALLAHTGVCAGVSAQTATSTTAASSEVDMAVRQGAFATAAKLLEKAAHAGNPEAQYQLASLYRSGRGVGQDDAAAMKWMKAAASQEHPKAQFNLAKMLLAGRGGAPDTAAAKLWLQKAAARGNADATKLLAEIVATPAAKPAAQVPATKPSANANVAPVAIAARNGRPLCSMRRCADRPRLWVNS